MIGFEKLYNIVKNKLSEKRFKHSESVVKRALEYAKIYNADKEIIKLVAIAHDIAKELTDDEIKEYINKYNIELDEIEKVNKNLLHSKIGAAICENEYGFTLDMVNGVKYHTTGREKMSMLEKIIYLADATEESRNYNTEEYARYVREAIDNGMVQVSKWVIEKLAKSETPIHIDTIKCYNYYINKKKGVH